MAIISAHTMDHLRTIEALAWQIVPDFYAPYFERVTGEYLVESGHTAAALAQQASRGDKHFLIQYEGETVGYFSLQGSNAVLLLSHFYVMPAFRGKGLGQEAMAFIDGFASAAGVRQIELFVLRKNIRTVEIYQRNGFVCAEEVLTRLGNGAVLEDYLMRKRIEN